MPLSKNAKTRQTVGVVFSPEKCQEVIKQFSDARIIVEAFRYSHFSDEAYRNAGFEVMEDISAADVMLGVKEVPVDALNSE